MQMKSVPKTFPQLDDYARDLLAARVEFHRGSKAAVAAELGVARTAICQALDRKYPANTRRLRAKIVDMFAQMVACPHLGVDIAPGVCKAARERKLSASAASRADVKHWQACQACVNNPARRSAPATTREAAHAPA